MKPDKVHVACPHCGHAQLEPRAGYSTNCRECGRHFLIQEVPKPEPKASRSTEPLREVACFQCGTLLEVALTAESTMCKRCSGHVDLRDYQIDQGISKNFRTHGRFVVSEKGYVFNTEAVVGEAVLKGRFLGKLTVERALTIYSSAVIKGTFQTARLVIPAGNHFRWPTAIQVSGAEIAGELAANLVASETVLLAATGRLFGAVQAGNLVVEAGAVMVGQVEAGPGRRSGG